MPYANPINHLNVIKWDVLVILRMQTAPEKGFLYLIVAIASFVFTQGCGNEQSKAEPENGIMQAWYEEISNHPDSIPIQIGFVRQLTSQGRSKEAIDSLLNWTDKPTVNAELLNFCAEVGIQTGDTSLSIHWMKQSLDVEPNQPDMLLRISGVLLQQQDSNWQHYRNLLLSYPDEAARSKGHYITGIAYANENQTNKAIKALDSSIIMNFTFTDAFIEKAFLLIELKKHKEALALLYNALELDRKSSDIHYLIGICLDKLGKRDQAIPFYQNALKLDPSHEGAANELMDSKK